MKKTLVLFVTVLLALVLLGGAGKMFFTIATGGVAGVYYPLGGAMAEIINKNVPDLNATAVSTGASAANINMLATDEVQMALVQNDTTYYAYNGIEMFKDKKQPNLRGIACLYSETLQLITISNTGIKTVYDLKGKRVAVGAAGSGTELNARQILEALGLSYKDITPQYLSFAEAANGLRDGNCDVAFITAGVPTAAVRDVAAQKDVVVVAIPATVADKLIQKYPFYAKFKVPKDTYPKQTADVDTLAVRAMLVVNASLDEKVIYEVTKAIFTNQERLVMAHSQGKNIKKETALEGMPIPLHPGADRFLKGK